MASETENRPILFDLTLSCHRLCEPPDGILRCERQFARALLGRPESFGEILPLSQKTGQLELLSRSTAEMLISYAGNKHRRRRGLAKSIGDIVKLVRSSQEQQYRWFRWSIGRILRRITGNGHVNAKTIPPGMVYVLSGVAGEIHDSEALFGLTKRIGMANFAICYNLIPIAHPEFIPHFPYGSVN